LLAWFPVAFPAVCVFLNVLLLWQVRSLPTTSGLETEWACSGRKGSDGKNKKVDKANKKRKKGKAKKSKKWRSEWIRGQGVPRAYTGCTSNN